MCVKIKNQSFLIISSLFLLLTILTTLSFLSLNNKFFKRDQVTKIYFADNISWAHQALISLFNKENKGEIEIVPIDLPFTKFSTNERKELLTRALRSKNNRIDIFAVDLIWVPRFAKWGEPLDEFFNFEEMEQIYEPSLESCYYNGSLVSVPFYIDIGLMYYRKDLLRRLPHHEEIEKKLKSSICWKDFIELHRRYAQHNKQPFYVFPAKNYEGLVCSFMELIACQRPYFFNEQNLDLTSLASRKSLQLLVNLVNDYHLTPPAVTEFKEIEAYEYSLENDALFFRGWPGNIRAYRDQFPEKVAQIDVVALPHFCGTNPAFTYGGWNLMISKFSTKKKDSLKFLKFVMQEKNQKIIYKRMGYLPVNKSVYTDSAFAQRYPELTYYHQLLEQGFHRPGFVNYTKISDVLSYFIQQAIKGKISVDEALKQAQEVIKSNEVLIH